MIEIERIEAAAERAWRFVQRTPVVAIECGALLKLENLQLTGSFKVRGLFAAAARLSPEQLRGGLITMSAGNAALAAAYVGHRLSAPCRVFMYETAPAPKIDGVRRWGATPVLLPRERLLAWIGERGWEREPETFIHPFADEEVIAGHGSLGFEILEQAPLLSRVVVPVGGGGLVSGVAGAIKARRPDVEVVGVQSDGYALWPRTLAEGSPPSLVPRTIADGTTAPYDSRMRPRLERLVDRWVVVPEDQVRQAVARLAREVHVVAEGAGALAFAALDQLEPQEGTVAIVSGGNLAPSLLAELLTQD